MSKKTIDEVIDQIEGHKENAKSHIESEWNDIKKFIDNLEPQIKEIKEKAEKEPIMTLTIVGVVAFLLGWLFGSRRK
jgi:hypothetical protein